jgi:hypothetical protein
MKFNQMVMALAVALTCTGSQMEAKLAASKIAPIAKWQELKSPHYIYPTGDAIYYSFKLDNGSQAHLIVVNTKAGKWRIRPAISEATAPTSTLAQKESASAAVNGGYFNLTDGVSAGYVVRDGKQVADPTINKALIENRSEIRFLDRGGKTEISIANHKDAIPAGTRLVDSLQAGPRLLPQVTAREEAFLRTEPDGKETDSIGVKREAARTAFGITNDGYAMMITVASSGQDAESNGVTLSQLADVLKGLGCTQAINLDGGASTTMFIKLSPVNSNGPVDAPPGTVVCGKSPETRIKSILLIEPSRH